MRSTFHPSRIKTKCQTGLGYETSVLLCIDISLVNILAPLDFNVYIKERMNENNMVRMVKRREVIEVILEFQKLFKESETISSRICCIKLEQDKMEGSVNCFDQA